MSKTILGWLLPTVLLTTASFAEAQQPTKIPRLGFLASSSADRLKNRLAAFQQGLHALGYIEGKTIVIDYRFAEGKFERLPELAAELVRLKVELLVTEGTPSAHAAKKATSVIPIVMGNAGDPVGTGLIASLAQPGGNITGLSDFSVDLVTKRLEILKEVVPAAKQVAVFFNPANPTNPRELKEIQTVAPALHVGILPLEIKSVHDIDSAFITMRTERAGAFIVSGDPMLALNNGKIVTLAIKSRLPAIYGSGNRVDSGSLMSYGTNFEDLYRRAANYVDKILRGRKPADLPVEQPTKFELVINLKTAKQIGLTIPPNVLVRADRVIK